MMRYGHVHLSHFLVNTKLLPFDKMLPGDFVLDGAFHVRKRPRRIAIARPLHDLIEKAQLVFGVAKELVVETSLGIVRYVAKRVGETFIERLSEKGLREAAADEAKEVVGKLCFFICCTEFGGGEFLSKKQSIVGRHDFSIASGDYCLVSLVSG